MSARALLPIALALVFLAGCGESVAGTPRSAANAPEEEAAPGFDECSLAPPDDVAAALGIDAMYVTARSAMALDDGRRWASCTYFPEDVPGMLGMSLRIETDTDAERFFAPFEENFDNVEPIEKLGDRTEAVAYQANGTSAHYIEIRTLTGDRGLHLFYSYSDAGGAMPPANPEGTAKILFTAVEELPAELTIADGKPEGGCADIDTGPLTKAVGSDLDMARSLTSGPAMSCYFSGPGGAVDIALVTDPKRADAAAVPPDQVTHADIGDGAKVLVTDAGDLSGRVNLGDRVLSVTVTYTEDIAEVRPADLDLVRAVVDAV